MDKTEPPQPDDAVPLTRRQRESRNKRALEQRVAAQLACAEQTRAQANTSYIQAQARVVRIMIEHKQGGASGPTFVEPVQQAMDAAHEAMTVLLQTMENVRRLEEKHRRVLAKCAANNSVRD